MCPEAQREEVLDTRLLDDGGPGDRFEALPNQMSRGVRLLPKSAERIQLQITAIKDTIRVGFQGHRPFHSVHFRA